MFCQALPLHFASPSNFPLPNYSKVPIPKIGPLTRHPCRSLCPCLNPRSRRNYRPSCTWASSTTCRSRRGRSRSIYFSSQTPIPEYPVPLHYGNKREEREKGYRPAIFLPAVILLVLALVAFVLFLWAVGLRVALVEGFVARVIGSADKGVLVCWWIGVVGELCVGENAR